MKYIYIDDDKIEKSSDKVSGFIRENLSIDTQQHRGSWEEQINYICDSSNDIDGLILDLELNDLPNDNDERACFKGTSLAQEIRTRQKGNGIKSFPIILFSAHDKLSTLLEATGKDLFDICIDKESVTTDVFDKFSAQLYALAKGYKDLQHKDNIEDILNINKEKLDCIFISELQKLISSPQHIPASFIIKELIEKQGLLINEGVLAARVGIDITISKDWKNFLDIIKETKYKGVFYEGWNRWWKILLEEWWKSISKEDIRSLSAERRVEIIKHTTGVSDLFPADKIEKCTSDEFWTVCQGYNRPLDPIDGLILAGQDNLYPWQEPMYVSIDAALKRKNKTLWGEIAEIEKSYFDRLKIRYKH